VNKKAKILFFCMIFVGSFTYGQFYSPQSYPRFTPKTFIYNSVQPRSNPAVFNIRTSFSLPLAGYSIIDPALYTQNFGFFCKKELQVEKLTKVPFKFRLGSVQQCDWMEGKANTGFR